MIRKPYPKLTHKNATIAAEFYMWLQKERRPRRPVEYTGSSRAKEYKGLIPAIHRMIDDGVLDGRTVGDAGWIVWCSEWVITKSAKNR